MVNSTFNVGDGATKNILDHPTKFLGCVQASSPKVTRSCAGKLLLENFSQKLSGLNDAQVRGEYKEWIYKMYHKTFRFFLSVNSAPSTVLTSKNAEFGKEIAAWADSFDECCCVAPSLCHWSSSFTPITNQS